MTVGLLRNVRNKITRKLTSYATYPNSTNIHQGKLEKDNDGLNREQALTNPWT